MPTKLNTFSWELLGWSREQGNPRMNWNWGLVIKVVVLLTVRLLLLKFYNLLKLHQQLGTDCSTHEAVGTLYV